MGDCAAAVGTGAEEIGSGWAVRGDCGGASRLTRAPSAVVFSLGCFFSFASLRSVPRSIGAAGL